MLPPGPQTPSIVTTWNWLRRPYPFLEECAARFGDTFSLHFRGLPQLVLYSRPEDVKEIFADDGNTLHAGEFNLSLRAFLGDHSVLMLDGAEHMRHRKLLLPPFHGERMQAYGQTMLEAADAAIDRWPLGRELALHGPMQAITLQVILKTVFGVDGAARLENFDRAITELLDVASWPPLLIPQMQKDLGPWSPWGRYLRKRTIASAMIYREIRERRAEGARGRGDILSMLLEARDESGNPMSDEELHDELTTLLVAGHETTATALAWTFRWLIETPEVTARLRAELARAEAEGPLTPERIAKLELVDAVAREALRLQPVIPLVGRILKKPARVGRFDLPAGVGVVCAIYLAQRSPTAFPEPSRFNPDRFMGKKLSPNEFFPFGGGVRRCIGMAFALYEMKMVIARVVARTSLALAPGRPIRVVRRSITMTPSDGLRVRLLSRRPRTSPTKGETKVA
jgi:cytochrome P450